MLIIECYVRILRQTSKLGTYNTCIIACVRAFVRPSEIWCPLNNFWKTVSIQFKFGMLIFNINTQVKFDLGYNPLIFYGVMGLL